MCLPNSALTDVCQSAIWYYTNAGTLYHYTVEHKRTKLHCNGVSCLRLMQFEVLALLCRTQSFRVILLQYYDNFFIYKIARRFKYKLINIYLLSSLFFFSLNLKESIFRIQIEHMRVMK